MKLEEFRLEMESYRRAVDDEARSFKDSYLALDRLQDLYRRLDPEERLLADQVLAEWVLSDDEKVRFDAMALVDDFKIASAAPALRELASRLVSSAAPSAPYERKKVERIISGLLQV